MLVHSLPGNRMRLDAGAIFGHVPKTLYQRWIGTDGEGRVRLANRSLLVDEGGRRVLLETGVGTFFPPPQRQRYGVEGDQHGLLRSLNQLDLSDADIDWVVLSHLHFDHAGGLLASHGAGVEPHLLFPRARFLVSRGAWERCRRPHRRDHASFIPELPNLLERSGRLVVCDDAAAAGSCLGDRYRFRITEGHTPGMLHALVVGRQANVFFCADLVPGRAWVHLPVTMGYDRHAERVVDEKATLFGESNLAKTVFFYVHDPEVAASRIEPHEGSFRAHDAIQVLSGWDIDRTERPTHE